MNIEIDIEDYLSHDEIKDIVKETVQKYVRTVIGCEDTNSPNYRDMFIKKLAKELAKEGCQNNIPNYEQIIDEHLKEQIKTIDLPTLFWESFGWRSNGNKIINKVLAANEPLIEAKIKQMFKTL